MKNKINEFSFLKRIGSFMLLGLIVLLFSSYMYQSFQIDQIMSDMHGLHKRKKSLLSETESLQASVDRLSNIDRISGIAIKDFDLVFSDGDPVVIQMGNSNNLFEIKEQFAQQKTKINKIKTAGM